MSNPLLHGLLAALCLPLIASAALAREPDLIEQWRFRVFLDNREVGFHDFRLFEHAAGERVIESEARFDVKILFINAYRYRHQNTETWSGDCLRQVSATTNANGKPLAVTGAAAEGGFVVETDTGSVTLDNCVMSFAYWNPEFLKAPQLLNVQTGEYVDVTTTPARPERVTVGDVEVDAMRYQVIARDRTIDLWYAADTGQWLALESPVGKNRTLRYQLRSPEPAALAQEREAPPEQDS